MRQVTSGTIWKDYWKIPIPHNVLLFVLKVNGLATQNNKRRRNTVLASQCEVCGVELESAMHACDHAVSLRNAMRKVWRLPTKVQAHPKYFARPDQ
jgi:formate dehydrogenase assembly factor FdhD